MNNIKVNIEKILENIEKSAIISGRDKNDITLIAVTKNVSIENIEQIKNFGIKNIGENKTQEILKKYELLHDEYDFHMIGNLQTNKVKHIINKVKLIQSVENIKLAREINKQAKLINKIVDILIEVNIAKEESKFGVFPENLEEFILEMKNLHYIRVCGLMTVAPFVEIGEKNRKFFRLMNTLFLDINANIYNNINMKYLSMGMSNDYTIAIEEGSNIVRIGKGIFGSII